MKLNKKEIKQLIIKLLPLLVSGIIGVFAGIGIDRIIIKINTKNINNSSSISGNSNIVNNTNTLDSNNPKTTINSGNTNSNVSSGDISIDK